MGGGGFMKISIIHGRLPQVMILLLLPLSIIPMFFYWIIFVKKYGKIRTKNDNAQMASSMPLQRLKIKNLN